MMAKTPKPKQVIEIPPVDTPVVHLDRGHHDAVRALYGLPPANEEIPPEDEIDIGTGAGPEYKLK